MPLALEAELRQALRLPAAPLTPAVWLLQPKPAARGHRVRAQDLEDLPRSWARQAKLCELRNEVPPAPRNIGIGACARCTFQVVEPTV